MLVGSLSFQQRIKQVKNYFLTFQFCPTWSTWGNFTECSVTCGGGLRTHTRVCVNGEIGDFGCSGPSSEEEYCEGQVCFEI